jgi:clan AA aspartic protease (TIGR02281 family)
MRRLLALCLMLGWASATQAASLDPNRIAAIDQAANAFLAKAAEAKKNGMVPRQSDPEIGPLLDTVFDTRDLSHGPIDYADFPKLSDWLRRVGEVGRVYTAAAREAHDTGVFGAEIGRFFDASVVVMQATIDCMTEELATHPDAKLVQNGVHSLADLRNATTSTFISLIDLLRAPGVTVGWVRERLTTLTVAAPSLARFLTPDQLVRLRANTLKLAAQIRDKKLRGVFDGFAVALAEPPPPIAASEKSPAGSGEIALENDGGVYRVPVRINGALTVKFLIDSGASIVALPQDLVDTLTQSGAIVASDMLGRTKYVAADGKRHKSMSLMLRRLDVGGHTVTNVMAGVVPPHSEPLLGMSFLAKFKSWTLDNQRHVLIITE